MSRQPGRDRRGGVDGNAEGNKHPNDQECLNEYCFPLNVVGRRFGFVGVRQVVALFADAGDIACAVDPSIEQGGGKCLHDAADTVYHLPRSSLLPEIDDIAGAIGCR
jgi:hypothetical protein